jgi:3',5'-cyclic AMP phosphodiesterase CpdA
MNTKAIIHISDLHISIEAAASELNTATDLKNKEQVRAFMEVFFSDKKKNIKYDELFLIISGDIANRAQTPEYELALSFIRKFDIKKENILIIPGNHDTNWDDNKLAYCQNVAGNGLDRNKDKEPFEFQSEKFQRFKKLYDDVYEGTKVFNAEKLVVSFLELKEEKLLIIGLNSCFKCNYDIEPKGIGYIDIEKLERELEELVKSYKTYSIIAVCHHNPLKNDEEGHGTGFEPKNWARVKSTLTKFNINAILFGHEHTHAMNELNEFGYLSVGSLSKKETANVMNVIEVSFNDSLRLHGKQYSRFPEKTVSQPDGYWSFVPDSPYNWDRVIREKPKDMEIQSDPLLPVGSEGSRLEEKEPLAEAATSLLNPINVSGEEEIEILQVNNEFHPEIFKRIKELKVFRSGHFHWSDNSRAHNWIDTPKLLNSKEDIFLIQKSILRTIEANNIKFDLIIGLGIEGNIIATRCAAKHEATYSYLPYSYRYEDHADYEKNLKLSETDFKKILIITDVVHDGKTIKNILKDESEFFEHCKEVEEINVVTLFFTGKKAHVGLLNDEQEKRFKFYYVSEIRVEECPYKQDPDWEKSCAIYCEKLDKVYEFYNKKEKEFN